MSITLRYTVDDSEFKAATERLKGRAINLKPILKVTGEYMLLQVDDRFKGEHDPDGKPWQPLAAATLRRKKGKKILQESGNRGGLRGSITYKA
ncbi:MAG TPA: phage virion morphogenesis protein [Rhodothermales bacterium]|nr:phage virion morphogenesis protein [Rhodothermales bacterium]